MNNHSKAILLSVLIIATFLTFDAAAFTAKCPFDNGHAEYVRTVNVNGHLMDEFRCVLNGHIFYSKIK